MTFTLPTSGTNPKLATKDGLEAAVNNALALAGISIIATTWAELSGVSGSRDGQPASVSDGDTGTHVDPITGATVANSAMYAWNQLNSAWSWVGQSDAAQTALDRVVTGLNVRASETAVADAVTARDLAETYAGVDHRAATWAALAAISGVAGDVGYVPDTDTGTHTDPVAGGTVPNAGVYSWDADGLGSAQAERTGGTGLAGAVSDQALADIVGTQQTFGTLAPVAGTTTLTGASFVLNSKHVARGGKVTELLIHAQANGAVQVAVYRPNNGLAPTTGSAMTQVLLKTKNVVAGFNSVPLDLDVQVNDLVGISGGGIVRYDTGSTGGGERYYNVTGTTPTLGALATDYRWEFGFTVTPDVASTSKVSADLAALLDVYPTAQLLGARELEAGNATLAGTSMVLDAEPVKRDNILSEIRVEAAAAGTVTLLVFRPPADTVPTTGVTVTRVVSKTFTVEAGTNVLPTYVEVKAGDLIGLSGNGNIRYDTTKTGNGSRYRALASAASLTLGGVNTDYLWCFGFTLQPKPIVPFATASSFEDTEAFILVWGVGQSNLAGRGTGTSKFAIEAGRSYKYNGSTDTLTTLADPTGTDATALTGKSSVGPALAQAVLEATNGRVGVIFVNTAIGATSITSWQSGQSSWTASSAKFTTAISQINALDLNIVGCIGVMIQGEQDTTGMTAATYKSGVEGLLGLMRTQTGMADMKLIMSQIGVNTSGASASGYALIRQAQADLARENDGILLAHSGAKHFGDRGLYVDDVHYGSAGLDEIGGALGVAVAAHGIGSRPSGLSE